MTNQEIAKLLYEIAAFLEMEEVQFKPRAYEKAAYAIEGFEKDLEEIYKNEGIKGLLKIPGIGSSIAQKIEEAIKKGKISYLEEFRKKYPVKILELISIEGIGPKMVKKLYQELGIKSIEDLEKAAKAHKVHNLEGFGEKSEQKILKGIELYKQSKGRFILGFAVPLVESLRKKLKSFKYVEKIEICGSYRRKEETIGDIDILVVSKNPKKVMDFFVNLKEVVHIYGKGKTKTNVRLSNGIDADLRVVEKESWGSALQYFTGNKDHNIALRTIAEKKGFKLNEYGLFRIKDNKKIAGKDEKEIYKILGFQYIPPELRLNKGELELAEKNMLPELIEYGSLKGDLQIQTNWSDGQESIEKMAETAMNLGLEYIAITDHSKSLGVARGLSIKRLLKQFEYIDKLNKKLFDKGFKILKSSEINILKDGSLDYPDEILKKMDIVMGAIHDNFNLPKELQTKRLEKAMENKYLNIIAHPTGRVIHKRSEYALDLEKVFKKAGNTNTILEIDAYPDRLDLNYELVREAKRFGVKFAIDSDAHHSSHIHFIELGIAVARKAFLTKNDILNTLSLDSLEKFLNSIK